MNTINYVSPTERVKVWLADRALHIRFNNPERRNALSVDMWEAVLPLLKQAETDDDVRVVVFSGEGDKAFVAGADISQFEKERAGSDAVQRYERMAEDTLMGIHRFPKPTIAVIRGFCVGGGANVAVSCDLRLAADNARFSIPATKLGLGYRYTAMKNLVDLVGPGAAKDIFFTARMVEAHEAYNIGLVNRIVPVGELDALVEQYIGLVAVGAPLTLKAGKQIIAACLVPAGEAELAHCASLIMDCFHSEDYKEGRKAFNEKRTPVFVGR